MGGGYNHRISHRFCCARMGKTCQNNAARRHLALTHRPPFGSSMSGEIRNSSWPGSSRPSTSFT
jgi:hypothetical protein